MSKYIWTVIALLFASVASAQDKPKSSIFDVAPYVAMGSGHAADWWTTDRALKRGAVEGNPALPSNSGQIALAKVGQIALTAYAMHFCETHGHGKISKVIGYTSAAFTFTLAAHNTRVLR